MTEGKKGKNTLTLIYFIINKAAGHFNFLDVVNVLFFYGCGKFLWIVFTGGNNSNQ